MGDPIHSELMRAFQPGLHPSLKVLRRIPHHHLQGEHVRYLPPGSPAASRLACSTISGHPCPYRNRYSLESPFKTYCRYFSEYANCSFVIASISSSLNSGSPCILPSAFCPLSLLAADC